MEAILELVDICKSFGNLKANDHINFKLEKGVVHCIVGENGAGKSTLMNIISSIYEPDSGDIILNGEKIRFKGPMDACKHGIGMVYQEFMLCNTMSVLDNIILGFEPVKGIGIDKNKARNMVTEICEKYHFNLPLDTVVSELPVSVLQQVEIVKVLYRGAEILILDEPTSVLTPQGIEGLFDAIRFLVKSGKTVIFITHKLREVMEIADRITVLKDGKVVADVLPEDVNEQKLASLMVGRDVLLSVQKIDKKIGDPILEISHLNVRDDDGNIRVKDLNLTVRAGEIVGIAGVANSGQSELVRSLFGDIVPDQGSSIRFEGKEIAGTDCRTHRCLGIGYIPEDRNREGVNYDASIWESSIMGYHIVTGFKSKLFLDYKQINSFTDSIIKEFSVKTNGRNSKVRTMSGGNVQKLIVGREFIQNNKLLIIVDPTRGIDIGAIEFIWKKIVEMAAAGVAILLVSHELSEVMELSDTLKVMYNGRLYDAGTSHELSEEEIGLIMMRGDGSNE